MLDYVFLKSEEALNCFSLPYPEYLLVPYDAAISGSKLFRFKVCLVTTRCGLEGVRCEATDQMRRTFKSKKSYKSTKSPVLFPL
jgi:hypothetical protein